MDIPAHINPKPEIARRSRSFSVTGLFLAVTITAAVAFFAGVIYANLIDSPRNNDQFKIFWHSWDILDREYYGELPETNELVYGAIQGLLAATGDRYTYFVPPVSAELDRQQSAGEFGGIGAHVGQNEDGQLVIMQVIADMPAERAGLRAGDVILAVDGVSIQHWTQEQAVVRLRGTPGTVVEVTIYRTSDNSRFEVAVVRARIEVQTVQATMMDDVGYVRLLSFNANATATLEREIARLLEQNPRALILDLRGNPGGLLDQAIHVSDLFLDEGVIVRQRVRDGEETVYRAANGDIAEDVPLVVLVDGGSASASEVVAGALRDRERAVLIGQTSYGKGSVQHVHTLPDGSQVHVTVSVWLTPNARPIQGQGLIPDIIVTLPEQPTVDEDPFIDAALTYINTMY